MISHSHGTWNQYPCHSVQTSSPTASLPSRQKKHSGQLRKLKPKALPREPARIGCLGWLPTFCCTQYACPKKERDERWWKMTKEGQGRHGWFGVKKTFQAICGVVSFQIQKTKLILFCRVPVSSESGPPPPRMWTPQQNWVKTSSLTF